MIVFSFRELNVYYSLTTFKFLLKKEINNIFEGAFCLIDGEDNDAIIGDQFVMAVSSIEFAPSFIKKRDIDEHMKKDEQFRMFVERLYEMELRKVRKISEA